MKTIRLAILSVATVLGSLIASAQQAPAEAIISSVSGSASVTAPGSDKAVPVVAGQKLPEGAIITTADGGSVLIQSHQGVETGVGANSTVAIGTHSVSADGVRTAVIDLKQGTTVSVLDPSKRAVNNYAVRTPKGVAAARGTTFSSTVTLSSGGVVTVTVNTLTGAVSFSIAGGATVNVAEGRSANDRSTASTSIADALKGAANSTEQAQIAEALKITVTVVSVLAQVSNEAGAQKAQNTLNTVVENITEAANEVGGEVGTGIVTSTVTAVATYAGKGSSSALAQINNTANTTNKAAATAAADAAPAPVTVTVVTTPAGPVITVPPPTTTNPLPTTPDITIIVTPSSP